MTPNQMKDLLNNRSKKTGVNVQVLQRSFMLERLLERISLSKYKDNFILKGGMLVAALVGVDSRSTMDMDTSIKNTVLSEASILKIFEDLVVMDIGDDIVMTISGIQEIREDFEYSCFRVSLISKVGKTVIPMKIDISAGDVITPAEIRYEFQLLLENRAIEIWAYNLETVLAEKMETIISRSIFNTRMRDFYDVYILSQTLSQKIDMNVLENAIRQTAKYRGTKIDYAGVEIDLDRILSSGEIQKLWKAYQKKFPYAQQIDWIDVAEQVRGLFKAVLLP